ncbi:DUF6127 family protein [Methylococcus sp. ANG]|uniref:DUF6127 family protein n=1 Tax=Methylococcus sp. ANG TaxID=3231903 RepID=UPI0034578637
MSPPNLQDGMVVMPRDEFEELLARAAERGARRALADVGLDGEGAAWQAVVRLVTTGFLLALVAGAAIKLKVFGGGQ